MTDETGLSELLACPRCDRTPLANSDDGYACAGCKTVFPCRGGIAWLFAEPDAALGEWRSRLHFSLRQLAFEEQRLHDELARAQLPELTQRRLASQHEATAQHRQALSRLLAPLDVQSKQEAAYESHLALRTRLPADQGLNTYYANVHRDWCWGDAENAAALEQLLAVLGVADAPAAALADTVVLGAGAGRLAYDLHQGFGTRRTVAIDFNPLLAFVAQTVMRGDTLELFEFPIAPKSLADFAVRRTLAAPAAARENFHFVLGDVLRAPFADASFDTVVTPWLIDIVSEDVATFAARINRLLKPGGRWLNFGSLSFEECPQRARRYSPEEIVQLVQDAGFDAPAVHQATIPYMCSPASRHGRRETTFSFCAVKSSEVERPVRHKALPDWLVTGKQPVPLLPSFRTQVLSTRIYSFVMSLIDGRRSIDDMARLLEQQKLMTREEAVPAIRNFLTRMYDDSRRNSGF